MAPWLCCCFSGANLYPDDHLHLLSYLQLIFLGGKTVLQSLIDALLWAGDVSIGDREQPGNTPGIQDFRLRTK